MIRAALAALLLLVGSHAARAQAAPHDTLVIGVAQFPASLHPFIDPQVVRTYIEDFALHPVSAFDASWQNTCLLCATLPTIENGGAKLERRPGGATGMAVTLTLKPDLAWGDGVPVTTRDIMFTWRVARDPASGFSNPLPWRRAAAIDVVDDHTVVLHLDRALVDYNQWDMLLPEHIEAPVLARAGSAAAYIQQTTYNAAPTTPGLWNGPFLLTAYQPGAQMVLEPNPHWTGHKPGFKRIVIRLIENTAALQANLLSGDVDLIPGEGIGLTIDQVLGLRQKYPDRFTTIFKPSLTYEHIDIQTGNPVLADVRVRQALLAAIDRQTLVRRLFEGLQPVADSWVNPLDPNHDPTLPSVAYDPAHAKSLLADAGWHPGPDGICRNAAGDRLSVGFATTAGNRLRELVQQVLQNQWKAACIDVTIHNEPARTLFGETLKQRAFTGMAMYAWSNRVGESPRRNLASDQIPTAANNYGGSNYAGLADPKLDADIDAAESELDPEKRRAIWADMQRIYVTHLNTLPLFFRAEAHVVPNWLDGYAPTGHGDYVSLWAENWHAK